MFRCKRKITLRICALLLIALLTACSTSASPPIKSESSGKNSDTITMMIEQSRYYNGLQAMIEKLKEEENINIICQIIPDEQYLAVMKMKLKAGEIADIIDYNVPDIYYRINPDRYCLDLSNEPWVERMISTKNFEIDGKLYAFPLQSFQGVHGIIYNKQVFADLGLNVPTNWDEFIAICQTIKESENDITPIFFSKESWVPQIMLSDNMSKVLGEEGAEAFAKGVLRNELKWSEQDELAKMIDYYLSLFSKGYVNESYLTSTYEMAISAVGSGSAAMHYNGDFFAASVLEEYPNASIGFFNLSMPGTLEPDVLTVNTSSTGFFVYRYSNKIEQVKTVLELWSTPEYADLYFENRAGFPAFENVDGGIKPDYLTEMEDTYLNQGKHIPEFNSYFEIAKTAFEDYLWLYYEEAPTKGLDGKEILQLFQVDYERFMHENKLPNF